MGDSFFKKENAKRKAKKRQEKELRREERKSNNNKGQPIENMFAYVDEFGVITTTPPDTKNKKEIDVDKIVLGAAEIEKEPTTFTGSVTHYSDKGYGFITDDDTKTNIFFHNNDLLQTVRLNDKVTFGKKKTPRGDNAIQIKKIQ